MLIVVSTSVRPGSTYCDESVIIVGAGPGIGSGGAKMGKGLGTANGFPANTIARGR
jgi:hypothetical protein